jgi:peroxiredoxin
MKLSVMQPAPDFELLDTDGNLVRLSDILADKVVVLVFNRGLA